MPRPATIDAVSATQAKAAGLVEALRSMIGSGFHCRHLAEARSDAQFLERLARLPESSGAWGALAETVDHMRSIWKARYPEFFQGAR